MERQSSSWLVTALTGNQFGAWKCLPADLQQMKADIDVKRARGEPTVPSLLGDELKCNPFLRPGAAAALGGLGGWG